MQHSGSADIKIEWISSFVAVVDHGGFATAAEATFRSQPRVSTHVAELERRLGAQLFDRRERPVRLTEAGIAFLGHARGLLRELVSAQASVQQVLGVLRGRVRLGAYPSVGAAFVPPLLRSFTKYYPHVSVNLLERVSGAELIAPLLTGEADLSLRPVHPTPHEPSIRYQRLWEEPLVAVLPASSPMAHAEYLSLHEVAEHPLLTAGEGADSEHEEVDRALTTANIAADIAYRAQQPQTLINMVREGLGIAVMNLLAANVSDTEGLILIPILESSSRRQVGVFWDSSRPMQPAARALLDIIVQLPPPEPVARHQRRS